MQTLSANLARGALDAAPDAMVIVDNVGIVQYANCRVTSLFGYYHDEVVGKPVDRLLPERLFATPGKRGNAFLRPALAAATQGLELIGRRRDGTEFPVEICLSPVPDDRRVLVLTTIRDVSDRRRAEIEMIRAREKAEHTTECSDRANRLKSRILATASHDLRQPLQAVSLLNGMLRRTVFQAAAVTALAQQDHAIDAMTRLLNALLDISKLESGAVRPTMTHFAVDTLFEELRLEFAELAAAKGLRLEVVSRGERIYSDRALVEQVLSNLLSNAIKYSRHGTVTLRCAQYDDASVRIAVADSGVGIAAERLDLIYDEFYQGEAPAGDCREGYGLGLSIVQRIVTLLNLDLQVQSEVGVGSLFSLVVPAGGRALNAGQHSKPICADREPAPVDQACVLLVEDDAASSQRNPDAVEGRGVPGHGRCRPGRGGRTRQAGPVPGSAHCGLPIA